VSRLHAVQGPAALQALEQIVGWSGGWLPLHRHRAGLEPRMWWQETHVPGSPRRLVDAVRLWDERFSEEVLVGLPQLRPFNGGVGQCTVLWARVEGKDQERRARSFRPLPSMVLQEGSSSRRWLIWSLREVAGYFQAQAANRKLAYALGATQKYGDPDVFLVPAPGTCLRVDRSRPVPVVCTRLTMADYTLDGVVGRLKEPPELKPFWERKAARS
jgi:hypothetical protein